jgi:hypothetical protein
MPKFSLDIDHYEKLTAVRRTIGLPASDYLEKAKKCIKDGTEFIVNGEVVDIKRGYCLN